MTAVEWLVIEIDYQKCWADPIKLKHLIKQAKELEEQQIINAYNMATKLRYMKGLKELGVDTQPPLIETGQQYYNETYNKK